MAVMIGIDPHKGSHTAVALDDSEQPLGELRVRSAAGQVERLVQWATPFDGADVGDRGCWRARLSVGPAARRRR